MEKDSRNVCAPLPCNLTKCVMTTKNNEDYLLNFLQNMLPPCDSKSIEENLRKTFIFGKLKAKTSQHIGREKKYLSSRKREVLGLGKVGCNKSLKYEHLLPLHELWLKYIRQALGEKFFSNVKQDPTDPYWENANQQLMKADFHGAKICVVRSKCPSLVGINGIIVQDTKNTFRVCGTDNIVRTLPKDVIVMKLYLRNISLQLFGKQLSIRTAERTIRKFKTAHIFEL